MSLKHLAAGSNPVPKVDGKLRLYSMKFCPYALRLRLVLKAKNIDHDIVNINLVHKPEWYFKIHPEGKVPALDTGSKIIVESLDISDFLDEKYPNPPLYPAEPASQEKDKEIIKKIGPFASVFYQSLIDKSKTHEEWLKELSSHIEVFENELEKRGTVFFFGNTPGMVDYMLWPWIEKFPVIKIVFGDKAVLGKGKLEAWRSEMLKQPAVQFTYNPPELFWKLVQARINNEPIDYDSL